MFYVFQSIENKGIEIYYVNKVINYLINQVENPL